MAIAPLRTKIRVPHSVRPSNDRTPGPVKFAFRALDQKTRGQNSKKFLSRQRVAPLHSRSSQLCLPVSTAIVSTARPRGAMGVFRDGMIRAPSNNGRSQAPVGLAILAQPVTMQPSMGCVARQRIAQQSLPRLELVEEGLPVPAAQTTATAEPKKSLWQTVTQPKVLKVAGVILGAAAMVALGGVAAAAAYQYYPAATLAMAKVTSDTGRFVALNTHQLLIAPGIENVLFFMTIAVKTAIIPAAKVAIPIILSAISTAIVSTLAILAALYVVNRAWQAVKTAVWAAGSAIANAFGKELDKTYAGMAAKAVVTTAAAPIIEALEDWVMVNKEEEHEEEATVQPVSIQGSDDSESEVESTTVQKNASTEEIREEEDKRAKPQRSLANRMASYALLAIAACGTAYLCSRGNVGLGNVGLNH